MRAGKLTVDFPAMEIAPEELDRLRIPVAYRDHCAQHFVRWQRCLRSNFFHWRCHDDEVQWEKCQYYECVVPRLRASVFPRFLI